MANSFTDELSNAGGDVVKGMAKTAVIGVGVLTAGSLAIFLVAKYVKEKKNLAIAHKVTPAVPVEVASEEDWL